MKKENARSKIIDAVYETVAEYGIENSTTKKLSVISKTSENVIYNHFISKLELFEVAFFELNCEVDAALKTEYFRLFSETLCDNAAKFATYAWRAYLDFWVTHPKKALFYDRYIHSSLVTEEIWQKQSQSFAFFTEIFHGAMRELAANHSFEGFSVLLTLIIESALNIAKRSIRTGQPISEEIKLLVCNMIAKILN